MDLHPTQPITNLIENKFSRSRTSDRRTGFVWLYILQRGLAKPRIFRRKLHDGGSLDFLHQTYRCWSFALPRNSSVLKVDGSRSGTRNSWKKRMLLNDLLP